MTIKLVKGRKNFFGDSMSIGDLDIDNITRGKTGDLQFDVEADGVFGCELLEKDNGRRVTSSITS